MKAAVGSTGKTELRKATPRYTVRMQMLCLGDDKDVSNVNWSL